MDDALTSALWAILPDGAAGHAASYPGKRSGEWAAGGAAPCRQAEFAAGRACACAALAALGAPDRAPERNAEGLPVWPPGFLGSISHSKGLACAAVAESRRFGALGLDVEQTNRLSAPAMRRILRPRESGWADGDTERGTLLFSLKETAYKAVFPVHGNGPVFTDLAFAVDATAGVAGLAGVADAVPPPVAELLGAMEFRFRFFRPHGVVTVGFRRSGSPEER